MSENQTKTKSVKKEETKKKRLSIKKIITIIFLISIIAVVVVKFNQRIETQNKHSIPNLNKDEYPTIVDINPSETEVVENEETTNNFVSPDITEVPLAQPVEPSYENNIDVLKYLEALEKSHQASTISEKGFAHILKLRDALKDSKPFKGQIDNAYPYLTGGILEQIDSINALSYTGISTYPEIKEKFSELYKSLYIKALKQSDSKIHLLQSYLYQFVFIKNTSYAYHEVSDINMLNEIEHILNQNQLISTNKLQSLEVYISNSNLLNSSRELKMLVDEMENRLKISKIIIDINNILYSTGKE